MSLRWFIILSTSWDSWVRVYRCVAAWLGSLRKGPSRRHEPSFFFIPRVLFGDVAGLRVTLCCLGVYLLDFIVIQDYEAGLATPGLQPLQGLFGWRSKLAT